MFPINPFSLVFEVDKWRSTALMFLGSCSPQKNYAWKGEFSFSQAVTPLSLVLVSGFDFTCPVPCAVGVPEMAIYSSLICTVISLPAQPGWQDF